MRLKRCKEEFLMGRRIVIIQGHPDHATPRLCHALADAYAKGAETAGHEIRRIEVAQIDFPLLRTQADFETGAPPPPITRAQEALAWAQHWVVIYPLWLGDLPALLKGFFEQVGRPGFAFRYRSEGFPEKLMAGRSARVIVTMGMPAAYYRYFYFSHSLRSFERNLLNFVGIKPVATTLIGGVGNLTKQRAQGWLEEMRRLAADAA
jgi:putative NADPH-quinone reductase